MAYVVEVGDGGPCHLENRVVAVDLDQSLAAGVVVQQWQGGRVEDLQPMVDDLGGVVGAPGLAATGQEPLDQLVAWDLQVQGDADRGVECPRDVVGSFGLFDGAGEAVEDVSAVSAGGFDWLPQDVHDDPVRHQVAAVDAMLDGAADGGALGDVLTQQITTGDVFDSVVLRDVDSLGAFPAAGPADQQ